MLLEVLHGVFFILHRLGLSLNGCSNSTFHVLKYITISLVAFSQFFPTGGRDGIRTHEAPEGTKV